MSDDFTYTGDLSAIRDRILAAVAEGVREAGDVIGDDAEERAPRDTGDLRRSRYVEARGNVARIGFRDPVSVIVHENQVAEHRVGEAKYLEKAMTQRKPEALEAVAEMLRPLFE